MYKIIGTDQKEYGPVSSDQIARWIAQGRVNAQTRAQADGGEWKTLGEFPEFAVALGNRASAPPAPPPNAGPTMAPAAKTSGLAIASLVLGILGFLSCGITAILGLILGIVSMRRIRKSNGTIGGGGLALAGTIVSAVFLVFIIPLGAALILPALSQAHNRARSIQCMNNVRQLSASARKYAAGHENHLPAAATWCESLARYAPVKQYALANFKCPADTPTERCDYAFNSQLDGVDLKTVNGNTVLFFEIEGGWDISGGPELLLSPSRHGRTITVSFADGHVEEVSTQRFASLRWNP
jgi:prepilin-type processing-associated H-X9-DG protein